jgi:serine/threonine protein kinase
MIYQDHIIQYINDFDEGKPSLVMELLFGNLIDLNAKSPITLEETLQILYQALRALEYLHAKGYAYRDIKPSNILVRSRMPLVIKLADFGLSQEITLLHTFCGTSKYRALEFSEASALQIGAPVYTGAIDIWSLGVVGLEYACKLSKHLTGMNSTDWIGEVIETARTDTPHQLRDLLCTDMLVKHPSKRKSAVECLAEASTILTLYSRDQHPIQAQGTPSIRPEAEATTYANVLAINPADVSPLSSSKRGCPLTSRVET